MMAKRPEQSPKVTCPYCGNPAVLHLSSARFYGGWDFGPIWACEPCGAWVGTHRNSRRHFPLGRLANAELRAAKSAVHEVFDPMWRAKAERTGCGIGTARDAAYAWLAGQLGIEPRDCHVGLFDPETCQRAREICLRHYKTKEA